MFAIDTKEFIANEFSKPDLDIKVYKVIHDKDYIDYTIKVDNHTTEYGITEYGVTESLGGEEWKDDVITIDKIDPCSKCRKPIYDCCECVNNIFNQILCQEE